MLWREYYKQSPNNMLNCPRCTFKKWIKTEPLKRAEDGRRYFRCGRCDYEMLEDKPFERIEPHVLYLDIEMGLGRFYNFDLKVRGEYISHKRIDKEPFIVCWSAGWCNTSKIVSDCVTVDEALAFDDARIISPLLKLIEQADCVAGHNVGGFDMPKINARAKANNIPLPEQDFKMIDTLTMARGGGQRKRYSFLSNRLDYLAPLYGFRPKDAMSDADWLRITQGDEKALRKMLKYNRGDVRNGRGFMLQFLKDERKSLNNFMISLPTLEPRDKRRNVR